ncbi:pyridoxal phosphate-dependent decarboxylase family protein [Alkalihalophilus pseudofirmus]|uniref:pyridoxal phosphate-dependent decarboxylase family protein n=1 Tax=Alkalihalophilus pseudofirmus TaxID=79885 RepID=UPI0009F8F640
MGLTQLEEFKTTLINNNHFKRFFPQKDIEGMSEYHAAIQTAKDVFSQIVTNQHHPYTGLSQASIEQGLELAFPDVVPERGLSIGKVMEKIGETVTAHSIQVTNSRCLAHLHCPPLTSALAAEVLISASNQSMDSWDQSTSATVVEEKIVKWLRDLFYEDKTANGVFTSGGTQSNLMGLLLARDHFLDKKFHWDTQQNGLPKEAGRMRIFCSADAHFTVRQSAFLLGLGEQAVIPVETDQHHRMSIDKLKEKLHQAEKENLIPFAIIATAGTTDFGSIDPLNDIARVAEQNNVWLHVDAAYGGALMLSEQHSHKLEGIKQADSITIDFHKLFYQPISCGAFLLKNEEHFNYLKLHADYLNPEEDENDGIPNLVTKSIQTTRRFDALKLFASLQVLGKNTFAQMVDYTIDLAQHTAALLEEDPNFEILHQPEINAIVYRYFPKEHRGDPAWLNDTNSFIRTKLFESGAAVIAKTRVNESIYLKFTLLNPLTTIEDIKEIINQMKQLVEERGRNNDR